MKESQSQRGRAGEILHLAPWKLCAAAVEAAIAGGAPEKGGRLTKTCC